MKKAKDLSELPKIERKALSQIMHEQGYSYRDMESYLGVADSTLVAWADEEIPDEIMERIRALYQREIEERNKKLLSAVYKRLDELIPRENSISEVIKAGEFVKGGRANTPANQTNVQVNFGAAGKKTKEDYGNI